MYYSYVVVRSQALHVRETAAAGYRRSAKLQDWPDDELSRIRAVLRKLSELRVANAEDAEDLVQETFLTMTTRGVDLELEKGLLVWSLGILRNKVGNYYRKARRSAPLHDFAPHEGSASSLRAGLQTPEARLRHAELRALITGILGGLTCGEREAVQLLLAGMATGEIAARLYPVRYQNVVNRLHRGRKKVVEALAQFGYVPRNGGRRRPRVRVQLKKPTATAS